MNEYEFKVSICGGYYCDGSIIVDANTADDATTKAQDAFVERWAKGFSDITLDVDYDVDLVNVTINMEEIERKLKLAKELCCGEELEITDCDGEIRALRYSEARGSAEWIDGMDNLLWTLDDAKMDKNFDPQELIDKYADAVCM